MKHVFISFLFFSSFVSQAQQWTTLNVPPAGRYDDVFFMGDTGWLAGGDSSFIYKTSDAGQTWVRKTNFYGKYLRSIEFATPLLGFCGSLDYSFYKTTDGGETWTDIANTISPTPKGICGLSAPTPQVIYGCGIWSTPAFIIKSIDGGNTWTTIDMSAYANALVDIHFINENEGFVSGRAANSQDGGTILYTADGGNTWEIKLNTMQPNDYVWKLQTYNGKNYYGSVESALVGNIRWLQSVDSGATWEINEITGINSYVQTIGFLDSLHGWTGGQGLLFETNDGGNSWDSVFVGGAYNRFFRVNDHVAYLTGQQVYKYSQGNTAGIADKKPYDDIHSLQISPNPTDDLMNIQCKIHNKTYCQIKLYDASGRVIQTIYDAPAEKGILNFTLSLKAYPAQTFYITLKTNEGDIHRKIIKN